LAASYLSRPEKLADDLARSASLSDLHRVGVAQDESRRRLVVQEELPGGGFAPQPGVSSPPGTSAPGSRGEYDDDFNEFFRAEYRKFIRFLRLSGASFEEAEDAVQQAMLQAYTRWPLLTNPNSWVRRATKNLYLQKVERDRMRSQKEAEAVRQAHRLPEDIDEYRLVITALRCLPDAQREVMALTLDGYMPVEIADLLQKPVDTVRSNLRHARSKLRHELQNPEEEV